MELLKMGCGVNVCAVWVPQGEAKPRPAGGEGGGGSSHNPPLLQPPTFIPSWASKLPYFPGPSRPPSFYSA
jgi:hypothetical protein